MSEASRQVELSAGGDHRIWSKMTLKSIRDGARISRVLSVVEFGGADDLGQVGGRAIAGACRRGGGS